MPHWYFVAGDKASVDLLVEEGAKAILASFAYMKGGGGLLLAMKEAKEKHGVRVLVDSGAYTNARRPGHVQLGPYCDFLKNNVGWIDEYIVLDDLHKRSVTFKNFVLMLAKGLRPMVVDHAWFQWSQKLLAPIYKRGAKLCWAGMLLSRAAFGTEGGGKHPTFFQGRSHWRKVAQRLKVRFDHAVASPISKIHLLAVGERVRWLLPFFDVVDSADATSVFLAAGFGQVMHLVPADGDSPPRIRRARPEAPSDALAQIAGPQERKKLAASWQERRRFNVRQMLKYFAAIEAFHSRHKSKGFSHLWDIAIEKAEEDDYGDLVTSKGHLYVPSSFLREMVVHKGAGTELLTEDVPDGALGVFEVVDDREEWSPDGFDEDGKELVEKEDVPDASASQEEKRKAQAARSSRYGVEALEGKGERLSIPSGFPTDLSLYGDPVNLMYPLDPPGRARNARARFKQFADRTYTKTSSKRIVHTRIVKRLLDIGASPSFDPNDSLDALLPSDLREELGKATTVQSVICSKQRFTSLDGAKQWIKAHNFKVEHNGKPPDETSTSYRFRQRDPGDFQPGSMRTITFTDGVKAVVGTLKVAKDGQASCKGDCGRCRETRGVGDEHYVPLLPVDKADEERRIVFGVVLEPDSVDAQGDTISAEEIERAAHIWLAKYQERGLMHRKLVNDEVEIYESYLAPQDMSVAGRSVKKGTWLLMYHILSDKMWEDVKTGKLTGFSMGGYARRVRPQN